MVKNIILGWIEFKRQDLLEEIEKEKSNVNLGRLLDGAQIRHNKYTRNKRLVNMEKSNLVVQEFIRELKFVGKERGETILGYTDEIVIDQKEYTVYYDKELIELGTDLLVRKFMLEISNAFVYSRWSAMKYGYGKIKNMGEEENLIGGTHDECDEVAIIEHVDRIYSLLMRKIGCAKFLEGDDKKIIDRYSDVMNYFYGDLDRAENVNKDKMLKYFRTVRKSSYKNKIKANYFYFEIERGN